MFDQDGSNGSGLTGSDLCVTVLEPCFVALRSLDPRSCDAGSVLRHLGDLGRLRGLIDSVEAGLSRRADTLHEGGKSRDGHDSLQGTQRASNADAKKRTRRANTLEKVPMLDIALAQGTINADHADAFAGVLETATDTTKQGLVDQAPGLVDAAKTLQPDTFRRHLCRAVDRIERDDGLKRSKRQHQATKVRKWINRTTGMYHLNGELDPELGARLFTALESEVETRWHGAKDLPLDQRPSNDRITAETLVDLVASAVNQLRPNRPELSVLIDYQTLLSGLHEHSTCETAEGVDLAPETIRRLACDANIIPIVMNGPNQRLDVGRANRTATTPQRKALRALHDTCAIDGCDTRFDFCHIHRWINGGTTDLENLVPLCNKHHHQVHESGWTIKLNNDRTAEFTPPTPPPAEQAAVRLAENHNSQRPRPNRKITQGRPQQLQSNRPPDTPPPHPPPKRSPITAGAP